MKTRLRLSVCFLILTLGSSGSLFLFNPQTGFSDTQTPLKKHLIFLNPNAINLQMLLENPPASGSVEQEMDRRTVVAAERARTIEDCNRAQSEEDPSLQTLFGAPYGPLTESEVAAWTPLFDDILNDAKYFSRAAKLLWNRPRPFVDNPTLNPCVRREPTPSYPSGHATVGRVFARILSSLKPGQADLLNRRGREIGQDRVTGGVHFPTDIQAGAKLGDAVADALLQQPAFQRALRDASH